MSQHDRDDESLRSTGATELERRLLDAAAEERPPRELSERMARAIGISLVGAGAGTLAQKAAAHEAGPAAATSKAAGTSSSLVPWITSGLVAGVVVIGAVVGMRTKPLSMTAASSASATPSERAPNAMLSLPTPSLGEPTAAAASASAAGDAAESHANAPPPPARERTTTGDLTGELALVDAAHRALAGGDATGALALARKYSATYPKGTFRPEAAAIRIEALVKLGRTAEARALADKFATNYGQGPLADRMAALVGPASRP
jgi:hypothetical protein